MQEKLEGNLEESEDDEEGRHLLVSTCSTVLFFNSFLHIESSPSKNGKVTSERMLSSYEPLQRATEWEELLMGGPPNQMTSRT